MIPSMIIDARVAGARMDRLPEDVRANLRRVLPQLAKRLGAVVEANMEARLQTRTHLKVSKLLVENPATIYAKVAMEWTGPKSKALVPLWLEEGTKPHEIVARNASVLAFYWPKIDGMFFGPRVNHPGNKAYRIFGDALDAMRPEIQLGIERAVRGGARGPQAGG